MRSVVETRFGKLRGRLSDGVAAFKGVPYAAPPFGANRLQPPQPVEPWGGLRDALTFGPKSPQVAYPPGIADTLAELVGPGADVEQVAPPRRQVIEDRLFVRQQPVVTAV
jgi:hypothetical protein